MRLFAAFLLFLLAAPAEAKPSHYSPTDSFAGDRYVARIAQAQPREVAQRRTYSGRVRYLYRAKPHRASRSISLAQGFARGVGGSTTRILGGRPSGCPARFCGCGASIHLFGRIIPRLNLAANWLQFPRTSPAPNMVAARRGHVFVLKRHLAGNIWEVHDSNSGGRRTRIHPRSIAGYAIVNPRV